MSDGKVVIILFALVALIAVTGLVLAVEKKPDFDINTGCYFNPSDEMISNQARYTCYTTIERQRVCCLNEYWTVL